MAERQSILEYVMTYGWVVLILVILGIAIYSLDLFQPTSTKTCVGFNRIVYYDHSFSADGKTVLIQAGNTKEPICITAIAITDENGIVHELESIKGSSVCEEKAGYMIATNSKNITEFSVIGSIGINSADYSKVELKIIYDVINGISSQFDTATCSGTFN